MENECFFEINSNGSFIKVEVLNSNFEKPKSHSDLDWISTKVSVKAGAFSGFFYADMEKLDFEKFEKEISTLYNNLKGIAWFNNIEEQVDIKIEGDGIGYFEANCNVEESLSGVTLNFKIQFDQSHLPNLIVQLKNIKESLSKIK